MNTFSSYVITERERPEWGGYLPTMWSSAHVSPCTSQYTEHSFTPHRETSIDTSEFWIEQEALHSFGPLQPPCLPSSQSHPQVLNFIVSSFSFLNTWHHSNSKLESPISLQPYRSVLFIAQITTTNLSAVLITPLLPLCYREINWCQGYRGLTLEPWV